MSYCGLQFGSSKLLRRQQLLHNNDVPTQSEVRKHMGAPLAEIFFNSLDENGQVIMGLTPNLYGPGEELWISPSDILDGKVKLTKPMTRKHIQAITHKGILELGDAYMKRYENEMLMDKKKAAADAEKAARIAAMQKHRKDMRLAIEEERQKCEKEAENMIKQFHRTIQETVHVTKHRYEERMKVTVQRERAEVDHFMRDHMEFALETQEVELIRNCKMEEIQKLEALNTEYKDFLLESKEKMDNRLQNTISNYNYQMETIRRRLECDKTLEVSNAIKCERDRCITEKEELKKEFDNQISQLTTIINEKETEISKLEGQTEKFAKNLQDWEDKMKLIIHEFQKFINFSLRAVPGQAEFLLTLEKLIPQTEQQLSTPESEEPCPSTEMLSVASVSANEVAHGIIDTVLHDVHEKIGTISSEVLKLSQVALIQALETLYGYCEQSSGKDALQRVLQTVDVTDIGTENENLLNMLKELPVCTYFNEILDEMRQNIDAHITKEILIKLIQMPYETSDELPPCEILHKILDGVYDSQDTILGKDILNKVLDRIYRFKYITPVKNVMTFVLEQIYGIIDVCFGKNIILKILNSIYRSSEETPPKNALVKIVHEIYVLTDVHSAKGTLLKILLNNYDPTHPAKDMFSKILEEFQATKPKHPGKDLLLTTLDQVYSSTDTSPEKEIMIDAMNRMFEKALTNPGKEILLKILDTFPHTCHTKQILIKILDAVFDHTQTRKLQFVHPATEAMNKIVDSVYEITDTKHTIQNILDDITDLVIQNIHPAVESMNEIVDKVYETVDKKHTILNILDIIVNVVIEKTHPEKQGSIHPEQEAMNQIVDKVYETIDTKNIIQNILDDVINEVIQNTDPEKQEIIHPAQEVMNNIVDKLHETIDIKHTIHNILDTIVDTVTQNTRSQEQGIIHPAKETINKMLDDVYETIDTKHIIQDILHSIINDIGSSATDSLIEEKKYQIYDNTVRDILAAIHNECLLNTNVIDNVIEAVFRSVASQGTEQEVETEIKEKDMYESMVSLEEDSKAELEYVENSGGNIRDDVKEEKENTAIQMVNSKTEGVVQTSAEKIQEIDITTKTKSTESEDTWKSVEDVQKKEITEMEISANSVKRNSLKTQPEKKNNIVKLPFKNRGLVGEGGTEHLDNVDDFLAKRINSLIKIFRQHVSLANLFVPHGGKC